MFRCKTTFTIVFILKRKIFFNAYNFDFENVLFSTSNHLYEFIYFIKIHIFNKGRKDRI